jgi:hypothetical protein
MSKWHVIASTKIEQNAEVMLPVEADTEAEALKFAKQWDGGDWLGEKVDWEIVSNAKPTPTDKDDWFAIQLTTPRSVSILMDRCAVRDNRNVVSVINEDGTVDDIVNGFPLRLKSVGDTFIMSKPGDLKIMGEPVVYGDYEWSLNESGDLVRSKVC